MIAQAGRQVSLMNFALNGALGRMGQMITGILQESGEHRITALVERPGHPGIGSLIQSGSAEKGHEIVVIDDPDKIPDDTDIGLDFSFPGGGQKFAAAMIKRGAALLTGTTGLGSTDVVALSEAASSIPVLVTTNTSLGVFCLTEISMMARTILGDEYDVEILEMHHRHKVDAPSGTAISLANALGTTGLDVNLNRQAARKDNEIGVASLRGGEVTGTHTVYFLGKNDQIEITHRATSRQVLAEGAIRLGVALVTKGPGLYDVSDLLRG